jgi:hypothetical protein
VVNLHENARIVFWTRLKYNRLYFSPFWKHKPFVANNFPFWQQTARSFGLSATSQQYFSLRTNQPPAISQQYFSLRTNQHQSSATSQTNMPYT